MLIEKKNNLEINIIKVEMYKTEKRYNVDRKNISFYNSYIVI